jgi:hypothetical protein
MLILASNNHQNLWNLLMSVKIIVIRFQKHEIQRNFGGKNHRNLPPTVTPLISTLAKKKVETPIKHKSTMFEPSPSYTTDYMVTMDHNGKIVVEYIGAYTKKKILSVWVQKMYPSNLQGPKSIWVPKLQA